MMMAPELTGNMTCHSLCMTCHVERHIAAWNLQNVEAELEPPLDMSPLCTSYVVSKVDMSGSKCVSSSFHLEKPMQSAEFFSRHNSATIFSFSIRLQHLVDAHLLGRSTRKEEMTKPWRRGTRMRDVTMLNSALGLSVVLILSLAVVIPQHKGVACHSDVGAHPRTSIHDEIGQHSHDHDDHEHHEQQHHHHDRKLAVCEQQSPNCLHRHGEEEEEDHLKEHDHHGEFPADAHSHSHSHSVGHHDHGESPVQRDSHSHSHDHESHSHSHNGRAHHSSEHDHAHHQHVKHLPGEKKLLERSGHGHSDGDEEHLGHDHDHVLVQKKSLTAGVWLRAMGCSLLVSLASLVCLLFLPLIVKGGKPSRPVVDALAAFGAGCMLGDALLHQLPHAFAGSGEAHSHSNSNHSAHDHHGHDHERAGGEHSHGHSLEDLSVGLAVLAGILLFFVVEKIVRRTEELSVHGHSFGHSHHHHHRGKKDDEEVTPAEEHRNKDDTSVDAILKDPDSKLGIRKRNTRALEGSEEVDPSAVKGETGVGGGKEGRDRRDEVVERQEQHSSNFVLSYLNLFSDGVHNFTDGMALGSAFLLHGTVGGWSRTVFLLAHELPQEIGDFGILLRSGFGVFEALAFNFLSALMALVGTALALVVGGNPGHSSLIEGFTAGGFIYIAVGAVMPDMHSQGNSLKTSLSQLASLSLGIGAAIAISLAE